ncbi:helix-turn-helix transcriptional regulator [Brevibacillus nitrificans]|uniref:helix-turn-helix domain-containing protein n=1 Tax=Brevibacillus nitrificans TaxID=651560 RepID=UPI00285B3414|nr:helix-turn-helix transcriptional regulator [Brevibacillus nitrificans]MDR7319675.1 transcriptional regulator with XRE-family HTH domain [Brevibacillus nitrificans]
MITDFGKHVRALRKQKGISLNAFAEQINVSPAYLSNLETGKTETIQLSLFEKLQEELHLFPLHLDEATDSEIDFRFTRMKQLLLTLHEKNPKEAEYLLSIVEQGLSLFLDPTDTPLSQH